MKDKDLKKDQQGKALDAAISHIHKLFGKGSIMKFGDGQVDDFEVIPTGSLALDCALGIGGFPTGRIVEICGEESSGKTTLALHVMAEAQKQGGACAFIDAEHALDVNYAKRIGVNIQDVLISQPDSGEQALEIVDSLVRSGAVKCIVIDSVAALVPKAELQGDMGDSHMGLQARLMSQALRKLTGSISKSGCLVIFINQLRQKIGVMFGNPETTTGGVALKFYSSIRIKVQPLAMIKDGDKNVGREISFRMIKNKCFAPGAVARTAISFGYGIAREEELLEYATEFGMIQKAGSWYSIGDKKLGQGKESAKAYLRSAPKDFLKEIEDKAKAKYKSNFLKDDRPVHEEVSDEELELELNKEEGLE